MLKFKRFQVEDLSRSAMHDGAILAWEPGLGKTLAGMAWPIIKHARRVLIAAPGTLHRQWRKTAWDLFRVHITTISNARQFYAHRLHVPMPAVPAGESQPRPRFYLTTYQDLGYNGGDQWADNVTDAGLLETPADRLKTRLLDPELLRIKEVVARLNNTVFNPAEYFAGIGEEAGNDERTVRCVWTPTLARVCAAAEGIGGGFDCVVVDEGTRLQANESHVSHGVRMLNPRFRLVLTGTPIKDKLIQFFHLAHWACGGSHVPTARWPYEGTSEAREEFANQHSLHDRFLTREEEVAQQRQKKRKPPGGNTTRAWTHTTWNAGAAPNGPKIERRSPKICNIHRLWKLLAPVVVRRRLEDCGEDIMPMTIKPIHIPPGTAQRAVYAFHLDNPPLAARATPQKLVDRRVQLGMQMTCLRQAALSPETTELGLTVTAAGAAGPRRSWTDANPKQAAVLSLIADSIAQGEQIIIGSPFRAFNEALHRRLREAHVSSVLLDGQTSPEKRGDFAAQFKEKVFSTLVAGQNAMGEGNSFECCSTLVLPSKSWALDENEQFILRVRRLNSPKPVTIYVMVMDGTIDEVLDQRFADKAGSASLALDGRLIEQQVEQVDLAALLAAAVRAFNPAAPTINEQDIEAQWHSHLRLRLERSEARFREFHPAITGKAVTPGDVRAAIHALTLPSPSALSVITRRMQNVHRRAH